MKSIRAHLSLTLAGGGALLIGLLGTAAWLYVRALLLKEFDEGLKARAAALVSLLEWHRSDRPVELDYKDEYMPEFESPAGGFYFSVWMESNRALVEKSRSLGKSTLAPFADRGDVHELVLPEGTRVRAVSVAAPRTEDDDVPQGGGESPDRPGTGAIVVVAGDASKLHARLRDLALGVSVGGVAGLLVTLWAVRSLLRRGFQPLERLSDFAAGLDADRLEDRFPPVPLPAEIAPIAMRLNELLEKLASAFSRERRFSADVAHELRTPVAELRSLSEIAKQLNAADAETVRFFEDTGAIARRMESTVSSLLFLARSESGGVAVNFEPHRFIDLISPLLASAETEAASRDVALKTDALAPLEIRTDAALFCRLVRLLLDNAVAHTSPGGAISLRSDPVGLTITNGPVTMTMEDFAHLGERFWRKDAARTEETHAGLGFSLANEISRLLGYKLETALVPGQHFTVTILYVPAKPCESPPSGG